MTRRVELATSDGPDVLLWDVAETCRQLGGISRRTLERMDLKPVKIGRRTFYKPEDVRAVVRRESAA
jgi:hypothetical protein